MANSLQKGKDEGRQGARETREKIRPSANGNPGADPPLAPRLWQPSNEEQPRKGGFGMGEEPISFNRLLSALPLCPGPRAQRAALHRHPGVARAPDASWGEERRLQPLRPERELFPIS